MNPGPWKFHERLFVHDHIVVDKNGEIVATRVSFMNGPLIAAAPSLLEFVRAIATRQDELGEAARNELELLGVGIAAERPLTEAAKVVSLRAAGVLALADFRAPGTSSDRTEPR